MTAKTTTATGARADVNLATILFIAFAGATIIFAVGFANAAVIHDAAHDTRHSISFPCH
jgi:cobalt transporter subunit CbtB